jgi:DNA-binding transcriptional ArsR family regulator
MTLNEAIDYYKDHAHRNRKYMMKFAALNNKTRQCIIKYLKACSYATLEKLYFAAGKSGFDKKTVDQQLEVLKRAEIVTQEGTQLFVKF